MSKISSLSDYKARKLKDAIHVITAGLSLSDLDILQNDVLSPPSKRTILPDSLRSTFQDWLDDSYGAMERETKMAPENQIETEHEFLEESLESDDEMLVAQAQMLLARGQLGPSIQDLEKNPEETAPDAPCR